MTDSPARILHLRRDPSGAAQVEGQQDCSCPVPNPDYMHPTCPRVPDDEYEATMTARAERLRRETF